MGRELHASRRSVLVAAAVAAAPGLARAAAAQAASTVVVFDADEPAARAYASARGAGRRLAVDGDRVRLARRLFGLDRPAKVLAMTRYADFLVLSETAREQGYRAALLGQAPPDGAALFAWTAQRV